ncbi:MAG: peptidase S41, partial [Bacteroidota bacterium]
ENGELFSADSIKFPDSLKFRTPEGKVVYGGGGIMPDYFVPVDTSGRSSFLNKIIYAGLTNTFAFQYADKNREKILKLGSAKSFVDGFNIDEQMFTEFLRFVEQKGIKNDPIGLKKSNLILRNQLKALIGRSIFNNEAYFPVIHTQDKTVLKAVEIISRLK